MKITSFVAGFLVSSVWAQVPPKTENAATPPQQSASDTQKSINELKEQIATVLASVSDLKQSDTQQKASAEVIAKLKIELDALQKALLNQISASDLNSKSAQSTISLEQGKLANTQAQIAKTFEGFNTQLDKIQLSLAQLPKKLMISTEEITFLYSCFFPDSPLISKSNKNIADFMSMLQQIEEINGITPNASMTISDRLSLIYNKIGYPDFDRERVGFGLMSSYISGPQTIGTSAFVKAYLTTHPYLPGDNWPISNIFRRISILLGVGAFSKKTTETENSGTIYTLGLSFDINPHFAVMAGVTLFDQSNSVTVSTTKNTSFTFGIALNANILKSLFEK